MQTSQNLFISHGIKRVEVPNYTPIFITELFTIAKVWKQPKCPLTDEWIKKMWYMYKMEHYTTIKINEILPFATTWMDPRGCYAKRNKSEGKRQMPYDLTYV